jgi:putative transposase
MRRLHEVGWVDSLAWVLMPDHLHWLLALERAPDLARVMGRVKGRSARRVNDLCGRAGRVWQESYHDRALRREEDLVAMARYVVANPLRAGLVERLGDYPHWDARWL